MEKAYYKLAMITVFLLGMLYLGYTYVNDSRYNAWASCWEWIDSHDTVNPNWIPICDAIITHHFSPVIAPTN